MTQTNGETTIDAHYAEAQRMMREARQEYDSAKETYENTSHILPEVQQRYLAASKRFRAAELDLNRASCRWSTSLIELARERRTP